MVEPDCPVSTNTATARSPWVAIIQVWVGSEPEASGEPYSAVPVFAPTSPGRSARNDPDPSVTTARMSALSDAASAPVSGAVGGVCVGDEGRQEHGEYGAARRDRGRDGRHGQRGGEHLALADQVGGRLGLALGRRHLAEVGREAEVVVDAEPEGRRGRRRGRRPAGGRATR